MRPDAPMLRVTARRDDGSYWGVDVRTMRQAWKVARKLRWRMGWPTWIEDLAIPADRRLIACWQKWHTAKAWKDQTTAPGIH